MPECDFVIRKLGAGERAACAVPGNPQEWVNLFRGTADHRRQATVLPDRLRIASLLIDYTNFI